MVSEYNLPRDKRYGLNNLHSIVGMDITVQSYRSSSWEHLIAEMREEFEPRLSDGSNEVQDARGRRVGQPPDGLPRHVHG
jgi:hypothetical protein